MTCTVNGELRELRGGTTIADLLEELGLNRNGVAVAVDGQVIPRTRHEERALVEGERIEEETLEGDGEGRGARGNPGST